MLMFKGASYFSLALGPSKLRTGPENLMEVTYQRRIHILELTHCLTNSMLEIK